MRADHKTPLVVEHYTTGRVDIQKMRDVRSVQAQVPGLLEPAGGILEAILDGDAGDAEATMSARILNEQVKLCAAYGVPHFEAPDHQKVGVAANVRSGLVPINGLRHPPAGDTTGWYIWAGEKMSKDPDFFMPVHVAHLEEWCPAVLKFLGLPPGWRFLIAGDYQDVWFDASLLDV